MTASDDTVDTYLLQLAQALKHESFFQCDLVEFLLERSLNNQRIGHHLFWELKAEMNSPTVGLLYGMILEAYLAAAPEHWKILDQQVCDGSVISVGGGIREIHSCSAYAFIISWEHLQQLLFKTESHFFWSLFLLKT